MGRWYTAMSSLATFCALPFLVVVGASAAAVSNAVAGTSPPAVPAAKHATRVAAFTLPDTAGKPHSLSDYRDRGLVVVYFMGTDCPISNLYLKDLADLQKRYDKRGVQFLGIQSNSGVTVSRAAEHKKEYKVPFPVLVDARQAVADQFAATRTAEVFVLDKDRKVRYHGEIDDRYGYTFKRGVPTRRELDEALTQLLDGKPVAVAETTPRGCRITRDDRAKSGTSVTYAKEISRILQNRCEECHRAGEVAPFSLQTYDDAVEHSAMIKEVVVQRRMPPWHADPHYGEFSNNRRMSQGEIDQLIAWIDAGAPLGNKAELPPPRSYVQGWQIGKPDLVFELPKEVKVPATGTVDYRYYTVPTHLKEDVWIQAAEARPGNPAVVHHIIVFCREPDADDGEGFGDMHICGTAPGDPPLVLPPGVARKIPAGSELIFQMHYTPNGKAATDRSKVGFVLFKDPKGPKQSAKTRPIMNPRFRIPAGDSNYRVDSYYKFPQDAILYQLMPHMHVRGKDFKYELKQPDGRSEVLLFVPQFDFNWQNTYRLNRPISVPKGSTLHCVAHFDNSKDNPSNPDPTKTVRWGDQTWEEMMIGWVTYSWNDAPKPAAQQKNSGADRHARPGPNGSKTSQSRRPAATSGS